MGCDIHMFVEVRGQHGWNYFKDGEKFYDGRSYGLFSILANVRNGYGFANCDTGDAVIPIAEPRGLPANVSVHVKKEADDWGSDGHSHSYHTLQQLLEFDWTQIATKRGYVRPRTFFEWTEWHKERGDGPAEWAGDISGPGVKKVSPTEMARLCNTIELINSNSTRDAAFEELNGYVTQVEWKTPYYKLSSQFLGEAIPQLLRLGKPKDVRIVFWFDN